jgi:sporulation protein YlmC with PRC-barrel domain
MKTKLSLIVIALAAVANASVWAQPFRFPGTALSSIEPNPTVQVQNGNSPGRSISQFVGRPARTLKGEQLGAIKDVFLDVHSGRVVYAVIATKPGDTLRLVPFAALQTDGSDEVKVKIEQAQWQGIPPMKTEEFSAHRITLSGADRRQLATHFGQSEPAPLDAESTGVTTVNGGSQLLRLGELRGKHISTGSEDVGVIDDVVIDSERMTAAAVVTPEKDFSIAERRFVVPARLLNLGARDLDPIRASLTRSDFEAAHQRESGLTETDQIRAPKLNGEPELSPTGRTSPEAKPSEIDSTVAKIAAAVQDALRADASPSSGSVNVVQEGGNVVLRGTVPNEETKLRVEQAVRRATGATQIDNQIRVESRSRP